MARAIWSGSVSFGLVNVPVKAYTAVRDHEVHFHQLVKGSGDRVHYQKVSSKGEDLDSDQIEMGYELEPGRHVIVDPDELERLRPHTTRTVDISDFVDLRDIDPVYFEHTYWLGPDGEAAEKAYRLLVAVLTEQQRVGIGTVVMRNKQYLAAVRPLQGALALSTMRFADEVVPAKSLGELPSAGKPDSRELSLAGRIVESMASGWKPEQYHDTYTEQLLDLIKQKAEGTEPAKEDEPPPEGGDVIDLMAALEASLAAAKKGGGRWAQPAGGTRRRGAGPAGGTGRRGPEPAGGAGRQGAQPAGGTGRPGSTPTRGKPAGGGNGRRRKGAADAPAGPSKRAPEPAKARGAPRGSAAGKSA